ncbi:hypothetical protein PHYSODRAFT_285019 [Phytophthora sojae]|uniref:Uncharacterized protein n=1 Tax=Phytophthora sojae (strain P6497) TaxID=1094619 RepID=G4YX03_PHYSP|nr:hypothetical protein PHYSODRAFT_285019 [Phytophthora sojae]EGZ25010.1 hypothetical protein PHYSODRAFT_285019 [Phytophthora sojae]|eukprot:XP_009520298.1 hypothetical protein PHYSODRAFT_285019 [Phytophthora sojae]
MFNWKAQAAEPAKKISYAEASKRNLPGFGENLVEFMKTGEDVEQPRRTFKKYYGLPFFIPSGPHQQSVVVHIACQILS